MQAGEALGPTAALHAAARLSSVIVVAVSMIERRAARRAQPSAHQDGSASDPSAAGRPSPAPDGQDETLLALARRAAAEHQNQHGQPIIRDALRARLGVSNQAASDLLRQLRASQDSYPPRGSHAV